MAIDIQRRYEQGLAIYRLAGDTTLANLKQLADRLRADYEAEPMSMALLDCEDMHGAVPVAQLHEVGEYFAKQLRGKIRLAAVNPPDSWNYNEFSEDVVSNRGGMLRHFATLAEARAWLTQG